MRVRLLQRWETLQASYWFVPSVMAVLATVLAEVLIQAQGVLDRETLEASHWLHAFQPDGARSLLSTVAGSMITVAGVTFSMTILAISHASGQMGPRILTDFMRDRGNQVTLGTFIATFIYCLLVLRTVRAEGASSSAQELASFVPQLAVLGALALAVSSVGVLIYFIHHVPDTLSMSRLLDVVGNTLNRRIDALYPSEIGEGGGPAEGPAPELPTGPNGPNGPTGPTGAGVMVHAEGLLGYLQYIDDDRIMAWSTQRDAVVELACRPGEFISKGAPLGRIHAGSTPEEADVAQFREAFICGFERTPRQDVLFPALELVEIAIRALSPGVNDPFTAIRCIDRLQVSMLLFSERRLPSAYREDEEGRLRVITRPVRFEDFADAVFDGLRPYARSDALVAVHLIRMAAIVRDAASDASHRRHAARHCERIVEAARAALDDERDLELVAAADQASRA